MLISMDSIIGSTHYDAPEGAGGGGGSNSTPTAPIGTEPSGGGTSTPTTDPQVYELDDNSVIRIKGSDKTLPFKDVRGFQSQFTKASQRAASLEKQLQTEQANRQRYEQELNRIRQGGGSQNPNPQADVFDSLRKLPYLTGEDAVGVVQGIAGQIQQRDQVLLAALKELQRMQGIVNGLHQTHTSSSFDTKINGWLKEGGYDPGYADLAKEIYLAYEGDDLDNEFPTIFANRVKQVEGILAARKQAAINQNRKNPFVPGKGGNGQPSKGLDIKPNATAREIADELWGQWNGSET